jgi:hypothetical protein
MWPFRRKANDLDGALRQTRRIFFPKEKQKRFAGGVVSICRYL